MPQQINLCSNLQRTQKQSFSAHTMAQALGVFVLLGGVLCATWLWNLQRVNAGFSATLDAQTRDIQGLKAALEAARANAAPLNAAQLQQLQAQKAQLAQREKMLQALQQGLLQPGMGISDRLQLIAQTIPAPVWVTAVTVDNKRFEVSGFTLEPAALNEWVSRLSASVLMQGLKLATVQVENTAFALSKQGAVPPVAPASALAPARATWSFNLVSAAAPTAPGAAEGKP
jgi:Tfp pilus assembly protein PilN